VYHSDRRDLTPTSILVADAHALPFKDESVDYVLSLAVLEHLRNPFNAGQEMFRVLRRGAMLLRYQFRVLLPWLSASLT